MCAVTLKGGAAVTRAPRGYPFSLGLAGLQAILNPIMNPDFQARYCTWNTHGHLGPDVGQTGP
jgi:hypothetical protein